MKEIMAVQKFVKDKKERQLIIQALNKIHGSHDPELDASIFYNQLLEDENNMLSLLAVTVEEDARNIEKLVQKYHPEYGGDGKDSTAAVIEQEEDENILLNKLPVQPESIKEPATQYGDIWQLGNHKLLCADFADNELVSKLTENKKMDMIFVDPPYNMQGSSNGFTKMDDDATLIPFYRNMLNLIKQQTKQDGHVYICCNWRSYYSLLNANKNIKLVPKNLIVWHKPNARMDQCIQVPMN